MPSNTSDPSLTPQDISTVSVSDVDSSQQHSGELAAASLGGQLTGTRTGDVPLGMPAENSELKSKPSDGETGESTKPTASGGSGPLGLGGGLQPKVILMSSWFLVLQSHKLYCSVCILFLSMISCILSYCL